VPAFKTNCQTQAVIYTVMHSVAVLFMTAIPNIQGAFCTGLLKFSKYEQK